MRQLVAKARAAVGFVRAGTSTGSGFLVGGTNHLLTCYHVIKDAKPQDIIVDFESSRLRPTQVLPADQYDLAILVLPADGGLPSGLGLGEFTQVEPGDDLLILGFPAGEYVLTALRGFASAKTRLGFLEVIKFDAAVARGVSGGPCIHVPSGKVVGVVSSQVPARAVVKNAVASVQSLGKRAARISDAAYQQSQILGERSGSMFVYGVDLLQSIAAILSGIAEIAKDLQAFSNAIEEFAAGLPLGLGYAISIDYYHRIVEV